LYLFVHLQTAKVCFEIPRKSAALPGSNNGDLSRLEMGLAAGKPERNEYFNI
jgi:hypothetical protein